MLTGEQIRGARALLRMDQQQLSSLSGVSLPTIKRLEKADGAVGGLARTADAIRKVFEAAGIEFLAEGQASASGGVGLRLKGRGDDGETVKHLVDTPVE